MAGGKDESHPGRALAAAAGISIVSSFVILAGRYIILANVVENVIWAVIGWSLVVSFGAFMISSSTRKKYTGKAFKSSSDFWQKFWFTIIGAVVFGAGTALLLGQYLAGNAEIFVTIAGRSYTDNDVAIRYIVAWLVLWAALFAITYVMNKAKE